MNKNKLNISNIETFLNSIFDGAISENTFFTTYPDPSIIKASDWKDMVLIDFPTGVKDMTAMGFGYIDVVLYARPFESGKKNVAKMSEMEIKLNEVIESNRSSDYMLIRDDARSSYDTDIDWHCNVISFILKVF
jgi:hypothetical protein